MSKTDKKLDEVKSGWQPLPKYVEEYKALILKRLTSSEGVYDLDNKKTKPAKSILYIDQYAKIGAFFQDKDQVIVQLKKLNDLLIAEAQKFDLVATNELGHFVCAERGVTGR